MFSQQLPYAHRRYDFYKKRDPNFNSPDPRQSKNPEEPIVETQCIIECASPRELDYEDPNADSTESSFDELLKYGRKPTKKPPPKPLFQQLMEEKPSKKEISRHESEQMVEWADVPDLMSIPPRTSLPVDNNLIGNLHIFAFTGVQDKVRKNFVIRVERKPSELSLT